MTDTLNSISLGTIQKMRQRFYSKATIYTMPDEGYDDTYVYDYDGVLRTITLEGFYVGTAAQQLTFVNNLRTLHTGSQYSGSGYTLYLDWTTESVRTFVETFEYWKEVKDTNRVYYMLTLHQRAASQ